MEFPILRADLPMKTQTEKFEANTQYNDWLGTIALDNTDIKGIYTEFEDVINDEHIYGVDAYLLTDRSHGQNMEVSVTVYTGEIELDESGNKLSKKFPILKEYRKEMPIEEFAKLFKRIELKFSSKNILGNGKIKIQK